MMEGLVVMGTGLVIVFAVLVILIVAIYLFGVVFSTKKKKDAPAAPQPVDRKPLAQQVKPAAAPQNGAIPPEVVAAISAAVYTVCGGQKAVRIQSIRRSSGTRRAWASAGIMENTQPF